MNEKVVRMRIPEMLYKKYKVFCAQKDLSIPKQTAQLIRRFVEAHEETEKLMSNLGK